MIWLVPMKLLRFDDSNMCCGCFFRLFLERKMNGKANILLIVYDLWKTSFFIIYYSFPWNYILNPLIHLFTHVIISLTHKCCARALHCIEISLRPYYWCALHLLVRSISFVKYWVFFCSVFAAATIFVATALFSFLFSDTIYNSIFSFGGDYYFKSTDTHHTRTHAISRARLKQFMYRTLQLF